MPAIPGNDARKVAILSATDVSQQIRCHAMIGTAAKLPIGLKRYFAKATRRAS